jgi:molecular chaperone GrpE
MLFEKLRKELKMGKKKDKVEEIEKDIKKEAVESKEKNSKDSKKEEPKKELTLEEQIAELKNKNTALKETILRKQADLDNYRKRTYKDISSARINGQIEAVEPILQVFDHFQMAMKATETTDSVDAIAQGLEMIFQEFSRAMDELGVEMINAVGEQFDPKLHDAMAKEQSDEVPEGEVIKQWSCGYKMGERLLKPAKVVVSSGKNAPEEN